MSTNQYHISASARDSIVGVGIEECKEQKPEMLYGFFIGTILLLVCPIWKRVITSEMMMMHVIAFSSSCHCENNSWLYFDVMIILSSSKCCIQWQVHVKRHACHSHKKTSCIVNLIQHAALHIMLAASLQHLLSPSTP